MPSLLDRCPVCGTPGPAGDLCSTPECRQQGARFAPDDGDPTGPDGVLFDLGSLQAQFADIPDPEDEPVDPAQVPPPPPPKRKPYGRKPAAPLIAPPPPPPPPTPPAPAPTAQPIDDENWAANWKPSPPRQRTERTLLVSPITDDEDDAPQIERSGSSVLTAVMVVAGILLLVAVVWLMLNPPAPSKKGRSDITPTTRHSVIAGDIAPGTRSI